jgi:hypothetical protein
MPIPRGKLPVFASFTLLALGAVPASFAAIKNFMNPDHSLCCGPRGSLMTVDGLPARERPTFAAHTLPLAAIGATPATESVSTQPASASETTTPTNPSSAAPATAQSAPPATDSAATTAAPEVVNGYLKLGFDRLASFAFNPAPYDPAKPNEPPPSSAEQIPQQVRDYTGKKALVTGFMLPVKTDKGLVTEFLLMRDAMMCCYGVVPNINEWIVVRMTNGGVQATQDVPLNVYGKLHVKELYENGYLSGIYLLEGEKMSLATK